MRQAIEGQKVMFTHGVEGEGFGDDHLLVSLVEAYSKVFFGVLVKPTEDIGVHLTNASWGVNQSLPRWVFTDGFNY